MEDFQTKVLVYGICYVKQFLYARKKVIASERDYPDFLKLPHFY